MKKSLLIITCFISTIGYAQSNSDVNSKVATLVAEKNYTEAAAVLQKASNLAPNDIQLKEQLANIQLQRRALGEALKLFTELKESNPNNVNYQAKIVEVQSEGSRYTDAIALAANINVKDIQGKENKISYLSMLAKAHKGINHWPNEIRVLKQILEIDPANMPATLSVAKSFANLDNYNEAIPYFEKFESNAKINDPYLAYELGLFFYNGSKFATSVKMMEKAKELGYKTNLTYYYNLANVYYDSKDFNNCMINLQEAKKISPFDQDVNYLIAYTYFETNRFKEARAIINEMLEITPNNADLVYFYGQTYLRADDKYNAEKYFDKAIKMNPALEKMRTTKMKF